MKALLEKTRNVKSIREIAVRCAEHPEDFDILVRFLDHRDNHVASMAAWAMSYAVQIRPSIVGLKHHKAFIKTANHTTYSNLKRNIMRAWQWVDLPEELRYDIADIALRFVGSPKEDIAVKAFSITVLQNCLKIIPELKEEILFIIEKELPHASAAFIVRARKLLKLASRLN